MNASPPILQIHLLLNVLNRFAFIPGLGEREQAGIEWLGDYLVAVHRLQGAAVMPGSPESLLRAAVQSCLGLNQWLREDAAPSVDVRCVDLDDERLAAVVAPLAARLQAALMLLDGRSIREVRIELSDAPGSSGAAVGARIEVVSAASPIAPMVARDGVVWVEGPSPAVGGVPMTRLQVNLPAG